VKQDRLTGFVYLCRPQLLTAGNSTLLESIELSGGHLNRHVGQRVQTQALGVCQPEKLSRNAEHAPNAQTELAGPELGLLRLARDEYNPASVRTSSHSRKTESVELLGIKAVYGGEPSELLSRVNQTKSCP
jgi:hypothetical protein